MLAAKTPSMVRKEFWAHLLGYNLLRTIMEQAAPQADYQRTRLSLQQTRQGFRAILSELAASEPSQRQRLYDDLLNETATELLPDRTPSTGTQSHQAATETVSSHDATSFCPQI